MAIMSVADLEREYGVSINSDIEKLASAISALPFKDEEDVGENSEDRGTDGVDVGNPDALLQNRKVRLIEEYCKFHLQRVAEDKQLKALENVEFQLRRNFVEYVEMKKEFSVRPDIWMGILTDEREYFNTYCNLLRECLDKTSCQNIIKVLESVKKTLSSCVHPKAEFDNVVQATQAALDSVIELGSHPVLAHLIPVDKHYMSQVGSELTGVPASWLSSSIRPPSPRGYLLKKYFGQEHAVAALENVLASTKDREGRPLGTFLFHDPTTLYWEDFAKDMSYWLYATTELSIRLDLSADVDTLLMSADGKGKLSELFEEVKKRPFAVVVLEKVDQAHVSVIDAICHCLTVGCNLEGDRVDFSKTIFIMVCENCSSKLYLYYCPDLPPLFSHSSKRLKDLASVECTTNVLCDCMLILREVKDHLSPKIWDLLDDVVLFSRMAGCNSLAYARSILREIAARFCGGRLIIYASEEALTTAWEQSDRAGQRELDIKQWLEGNVVPTLQEMVDRSQIGEKSVVFIDTLVGTNEFSYRVEKDGSHLGDDITKDFSVLADGWRAMYGKGKVLEDNMTCLKKRLAELSAASNAKVKGEAIPLTAPMQAVIEIVNNAIGAANDINSYKEVYGCSLEKANAEPSVSKKAKIGVESLRSTVTSHSARPEIIESVKGALLRKSDASVGIKRSPSSYLLLGLETEGKGELLVELEGNFKDVGVPLLKMNCSDYSSEGSLSRLLASSPRSSSDGHGWFHLVETVREHPHCILYFDQVERASMPFFSLLISLLVHGVSIDSEGNVVDFGRAVILISSNIGNKHVMSKLVRRSSRERKSVELDDPISSIPRQAGFRFRSELVQKVDEVIVFDPFAHAQLKSLARIPITAGFLQGDERMSSGFHCLFDANVNLSDKVNCWSFNFSDLLKRVTRELAASGL